MNEYIIIYTKYYSEAVVELLEEYDLNITIICLSSYDQVLEKIKTTPNLRGVVFLEYKPRTSVMKAYTQILTVLDEIAECSKLPMCVSILNNNDVIYKSLFSIKTKYLDILHKKFMVFNTDLLKYEGIATIISRTIGVMNQSVLQTIGTDSSSGDFSSDTRSELLKTCLLISSVAQEELSSFSVQIANSAELQKLAYLRENSDRDELYLSDKEFSLFNSFYKACIDRRKQDEREVERGY